MKKMHLMGLVAGAVVFLLPGSAIRAFADTSISPTPTNVSMPVVTIYATDPWANWGGDPGVFTVVRDGNPFPSLMVYYAISGTASNGLDYQRIGNWVNIPSGVRLAEVVIRPTNLVLAVTKTVTLTLTNSMLMGPVGGGMPVNCLIGSPSRDTVYIGPGVRTNLPPRVTIASPPEGAVFYTPVNIPIVACAHDLDGVVKRVEFFANNVSLGVVTNPVRILPSLGCAVPPLPPMPPYQPFVLIWSNAPPTNYVLTAKATDDDGASTLSLPVHITVRPGPPPPPSPLIVRITSPANNSVFRAPVNLPIVAFAADRGGWVTNVEFFAGTNDLGPGHRISVSPGPPPSAASVVVPTNYWVLVWSNTPPGNYPLAGVAADNRGLTATSDPVHVTILPPPVISNVVVSLETDPLAGQDAKAPPRSPNTLTNVLAIFATDPIAIEGTNCWPWLNLAACASTWDTCAASNAVYRYFTNCGPKSAVFTVRRLGDISAALTVSYAIGGTASNGVDYVTLPGTVTIPAGQFAAMIVVAPLDDGQPDITSTVILRLLPAANALLDPRHRAAAALILDFPTLPRPGTVLPDLCFRIHAAGPDGDWFRIEGTSDLRTWTPICTNQLINGWIDFVDPDAHDSQSRFYHTVSDPGPLQ
jgi:hypothetical protein